MATTEIEAPPQQQPAKPVAGHDLEAALRADDDRGFLKQHGLKLLLGLMFSTAVVTAVVWYARTEDGPGPEELELEALELLDRPDDSDAWQRARDIARHLESISYRSADFGGVNAYILGMVAFRATDELDEYSQKLNYQRVIEYLREAKETAMPEEREPEWDFAMGKSLYAIGYHGEARKRLEAAVESFDRGKQEASILLAEIYLTKRSDEDLQKALALCESVDNIPGLPIEQHDLVHQLKAQIYLALNRNTDAQEMLANVSDRLSDDKASQLLKARIEISCGNYSQAMEILEPIAADVGLERTHARQAEFLRGICAEKMGNAKDAIKYYKQTDQRYEKTDEGFAANLRAAWLLQKEGRDEETLEAYRRALRTIRSPNDFGNRWVSKDDVKKQILDARNDWLENPKFAEMHEEPKFSEAIALSMMMVTLLPQPEEAFELAALVHRRWAEYLEADYLRSPYSQRAAKEKEYLDRWRLSGKAFAELAERLRTSVRYPEIVWTSAEHFYRGKDFTSALKQLNLFIDTHPKRLLPTALVRRGQVLMDLDRLDEALDNFQEVIDKFSSDPASFEAFYLLGTCHLERNEPAKADDVWRDILSSDVLKPTAKEWRLALFSRGKLQFQQGELKYQQAEALSRDNNQAGNDEREAAYRHWEGAIRLLGEYIRRYPQSTETIEARYFLARALQGASTRQRAKLLTAETENARQDLKQQIQTLLREAVDEFGQLQSLLIERDVEDRLSGVEKKILIDSFFEKAHTLFLLEDYEEAIGEYNVATHRYPQDARVLLAYLQMTNCYERLGRRGDARIMLEQAKVFERRMNENVFNRQDTNMTRDEWKRWLEWANRLYAVERS